MRIHLQNVEILAERGDISAQPNIDVVVNAANAALRPGAGVAGALHSAAGSGLYEECKALAPIKPGEAVITSAHGLPNKFVVHCLGPVYGRDTPEAELLAGCYRRALELADEKKLNSIAFPAISTGVFGYPVEKAAKIAVKTLIETIPSLRHLQKIKFVLFSEDDLKIYDEILAEATK